MPDQTTTQPNQSNSSFSGEYLPDIKNWLLGMGGAALGAKSLGSLIPIWALKKLGKGESFGGVSSMHPAVAKEQGLLSSTMSPDEIRQKLTSPEAVKEQRALDDYVVKNYPQLNSNSSIPKYQDLYNRKYGWQVSPVTNTLTKEVPDLGLDVNRTTHELTHPQEGLLEALKVNPKVKFEDYNKLYNKDTDLDHYYASGNWQKGTNGNLGEISFSNKFINPNRMNSYPWDKGELNTVAAHELQHAAHENLSNYNFGIPWAERPEEKEAEISAFRYKYGDPYNGTSAYDIPFSELSSIDNPADFNNLLKYKQEYPNNFHFQDVSPFFKDKGLSLNAAFGNDYNPTQYSIRKWGTKEQVSPNDLDPDLKNLYDRLKIR